ncbi:MAG: circadian clock KaiB family protein [Candidatus Didemnitutus sp.]|nr:circadian clock KaiB family protein [Candidatus Didemnitutus sp.]
MKLPKKKKPSRRKPAGAKSPAIAVKDKYVLRLFVAGATARSRQAVLHVRELCETTLKDRVILTVVDIYQESELAREHQIVATPTLILELPRPVRRFIGNLATLTDLFSLIDLGAKGRIVL